MAAPTLIDLSNYSTLLKLSTNARGSAPNGNIFFNVASGTIELITLEELATVDLGSGAEANPLTNQTGIFIGAIYAFERASRRTNEFLRQYDSSLSGTFKFAGAYELINGRLFSTTGSPVTDDRKKVRGSGWLERGSDGIVDKIWFGIRSLGNIESASQPYYQLSAGGAPVDFAKAGDIDEAIEVTAPANYLTNKVRTFGYNFDEKTLVDSGITEMSGYSAGFALGESVHLTTGAFALADVYGGAQIAPWTGMTLEKLASAQSEDGFTQGDGKLFTWVLHNNGSGTLNECVAFLDALAQTDNDIDSGALTITNGKRVGTWYTYDAQGRVVTRSGADISRAVYRERVRPPTSNVSCSPMTVPALIPIRSSWTSVLWLGQMPRRIRTRGIMFMRRRPMGRRAL